MSPQTVVELGQSALTTIMILAAPLLLAGAAVATRAGAGPGGQGLPPVPQAQGLGLACHSPRHPQYPAWRSGQAPAPPPRLAARASGPGGRAWWLGPAA